MQRSSAPRIVADMWSAEDVDCDPRRVVGAVYRQLASRGLIERTGRFVENSDTAGHNGGASHQLPVWRICSWERPEPVAARLTAAHVRTADDDWLFGDLDVATTTPMAS
jgi:hypothetical protein